MHKRRYLSPAEKAKVITAQDHLCGCGCKEKLQPGKIDFDHWTDLQFGGTNELSNFRALVRKHHLKKTGDNNTVRAKCDRLRAKHQGTWLNARDRELARILGRTKQIQTGE